MEVLSREFTVALPWELLYADELVVIAETEDDLIKGLQTGHFSRVGDQPAARLLLAVPVYGRPRCWQLTYSNPLRGKSPRWSTKRDRHSTGWST